MLVQLEVERHEASEGDEVGFRDLAEEPARVGGAAEVGVGPEHLTGDGLVARVEAMDEGPSVDLLELPYRFAAVG